MKTMKTIKTISERTGLITEREVEINNDRFLICVCKFGRTWSYFVFNIDGQIVDNEPFQEVIDNIMQTWKL